MTALTSLFACAQTANEEYPGVHVLQYHHVSEKTPAVTSISPDQFEQHLRYLKEHDFNVVAIEQAAEWVDAGANIGTFSVPAAVSLAAAPSAVASFPPSLPPQAAKSRASDAAPAR